MNQPDYQARIRRSVERRLGKAFARMEDDAVSLFDGRALTIEECKANKGDLVKQLKDRIEAAMTEQKITTFTTDEGWTNTHHWHDYYNRARALGLCTAAELEKIESSMTDGEWFKAFK